MMATENAAFTDRVIRKLQRMSIESPFAQALTAHLMRWSRLFWDDEGALFWVILPGGKAEVAVWMMPVALKFEPAGRGAR